MTDESMDTMPLEHNIDYHIVTLFERLEAMRKDTDTSNTNNRLTSTLQPKRSMHLEIRTLEFWRSIISECLASFFYVFIVCGAAVGAGVGASVSSVLLATSLASGFGMATLTHCFIHISGAHINPAVTLAACVIRAISPIRAAMYITAQCGGGIAGAALLYGITVPGYQGNLQAAISHSASLAAWERFGVEFIMTFVVVLSYFVSTDPFKKVLGNSALAIGVAYSSCNFVSMPYLNPARSLGPSFVLNKWENHWVYWFGPLIGGILSGIVYEFIFHSRRQPFYRLTKPAIDKDSSSLQSDDDINYDVDVEKKIKVAKYSGTFHDTQTTGDTQPTNSGINYCQNLYTIPPLTYEPSESLYGGTRSMYCRSPTLTRSNLNRSQSVYAKSNTAINREIIPRSGPLVPAQSLYPMRVSQQSSHLQNQNVQNQMQQRSETIYNIRGSARQLQQQQKQKMQQQNQHQQQNTQQLQNHQQSHQQQDSQQGFQPVYGTRHNPNPTDGNLKFMQRPESVYGITVNRNRGQSAQSDDSSYGSYHGSTATPPARKAPGESRLMYAPQPHTTLNQGSATLRTQSERKISTLVVSSQSQPCSSTLNFSTTSGTPPENSQQQQPMLVQPHPHYGMLPVRQT